MTDRVTNKEPFSFDQLSNLFVEAQSFTSPSQLHGLLCGQLSAGLRPSHQSWLEAAADQMACAQDLDVRTRSRLVDFYDAVLADISLEDLSFHLLLPDTDESVEQRAEALGAWCSGFLSGYGMAGVDQKKLSEEAMGALTDLAQIAQVQADDLEASEETEKDFFEVCEYVRMAALMLFNEHQDDNSSAGKVQTHGNASVH